MENRFIKFSNLILEINRSIQRIKNQEMNYVGLKGSQVLCLYNLYISKEGLSHAQLCDICHEDKGAMTRTIKELELADYLYSSKSGYKSPIKLTDKGRVVGEFISNKIDERFQEGSQGIGAGERELFYKQLELISENLINICENYGGNND